MVGVQVKVDGLPAVREKPEGSVKGFGLLAARATARKPLRAQRETMRILKTAASIRQKTVLAISTGVFQDKTRSQMQDNNK